MITEIHILLTYKCILECDHCFCHSSPRANATMSLQQVGDILDEAEGLENIIWIYFEGGEAFLFYPLLLEAVKLARRKGLRIGLVTNAYWATSVEDAEIWLRPLAEIGIDDLSISDDHFHYENDEKQPKNAVAAAEKLSIPVTSISIKKPFIELLPGEGNVKGEKVNCGGAMLKGRAAEKLTDNLPTTNSNELNICPHEDLETPTRVHVDSYGFVQLCQGLSIGNMFEKKLSEIIDEYEPHSHPICGPLIEGGPAFLAKENNVEHKDEYVDECHFCYEVRKSLINHFPEYLAPKQVYGITE